MPHSDGDNKPWAIGKIAEINPATVLDVGAGAGIWSDIITKICPSVTIDAIEAWEPYIGEFDLTGKYNNVFLKDAREHDDFNYDLVIFGDVLEHMSEEDAVALWGRAKSQAKYAIISVPIIHYPQGPHAGNPYEVHVVEDWTTEKVLKAFSDIVDYKELTVTGIYLAKF